MNSELHIYIYYLGLLGATILLSRFIFKKYIQFAKNYNLVKAVNSRAAHKGTVFTGAGVVYAAVLMVAAVILDNLDFIEFSNFSPIVATGILVSILGFYDDFVEISAFNKYITLTFLILMLLYSNATLPVIQNLNGFLGLNDIGIFSFSIWCFNTELNLYRIWWEVFVRIFFERKAHFFPYSLINFLS